MPTYPWGPPLNENDYKVRHGASGDRLMWLSEWVSHAKFTITKSKEAAERLDKAGMLNDELRVNNAQRFALAGIVVQQYSALFPELDEHGNCTVPDKAKGNIDRSWE